MEFYKSIVKEKKKDNIKTEIFRHTISSILIIILLVLSSFIEAYFSSGLLSLTIKMFA